MKAHIAKIAGQYKVAQCGVNSFHKSGRLITEAEFRQELREGREKFLCDKCKQLVTEPETNTEPAQ